MRTTLLHFLITPSPFYEATVVKSGIRLVLVHGVGPVRVGPMRVPRIVFLAGSERLLSRSRAGCADPPFIRSVSGGAVPVPRSRVLRGNVPSGGSPLSIGVFQPGVRAAHTPPGPARPRPAGAGSSRFRDQASRAPVGTRPVSQKRQSAISSLRASATIITRRARPPAPAVRASNHWLSALSG